MIAATLQVAVCAASFIIIGRTFPPIVRMNRETHLAIRIAMHFLFVGSIAQIFAVVCFGYIPEYSTALVMVGSATLIVCERRLRFLTGPVHRNRLTVK